MEHDKWIPSFCSDDLIIVLPFVFPELEIVIQKTRNSVATREQRLAVTQVDERDGKLGCCFS